MFKQCDLIDKTEFIEPAVIIDSVTNIRYTPFTRRKPDGTTPAWAGVNEYGVCFVAADSYLPNAHNAEKWGRGAFKSPSGETVFDMYLDLITQFHKADDAVKTAERWYKEHFAGDDKQTDILFVADAYSSYFIEARGNSVVAIKRNAKFFCSTNHLRMIYGAQPYEENHSTYLRLQRAEAVLAAKPSHEGVGDLLRDKYYGDSVWSICRSSNISVVQEQPYFTQASVIFNVPQDKNESKDVVVEYVINNNPSVENVAQVWRPFTGTAKQTIGYIGQGDL